MKNLDRLLDFAREVVDGGKVDQGPPGPVKIAGIPKAPLRLPEEIEGLGRAALIPAERAFQIKENRLVRGGLRPAPQVGASRGERLFGTVKIGAYPSRIGEVAPGPGAEVLESFHPIEGCIELIRQQQRQRGQNLRLFGIVSGRRQAPLDQQLQDAPGPEAWISPHQGGPGSHRPPEQLDNQLRRLDPLLNEADRKAETGAGEPQRRRDLRIHIDLIDRLAERPAPETLAAPLALAEMEENLAPFVALIQQKRLQMQIRRMFPHQISFPLEDTQAAGMIVNVIEEGNRPLSRESTGARVSVSGESD